MPYRRHSVAARIACALLLAGLLPAPATAAPMTGTVAADDAQAITIAISQPTSVVSMDGRMRLSVAVSLTAPAEYVEVRVRLRSPAGRIVYQKTEVRSDLPAGTNVITFERELGTLGLKQGRYPIEVRVLATGAEATTATSRLLVRDPDAEALKVAVVVTESATPGVTMAGRLWADPGEQSRVRDDLALITQLALDRGEPIALAVPPVLVEQCARVAAGYETTSGVVVAPDTEPALRYARMLEALQSAVATGAIELVDVPYALPDLPGLARMGAEDDLAAHWALTDAVNASTFRPDSRPTAGYVGEYLSDAAVRSLADRGVSCVLVPPTAISSDEATPAPGCYTIDGRSVRVLVVDEAAARGALEGPEAFYDALFAHAGGPVVVQFDLGEGRPHTVTDVQHALDWIEGADWLDLSSLGALADGDASPTAAIAALASSTAPSGYWSAIADDRLIINAYVGALTEPDAGAEAARRAMLTAESALFAGADGAWVARDRAAALAADAAALATAQFGLIQLDAKDVTLSGTRGDVPLTLINDTGARLRVTLVARSKSGGVTIAPREVDLEPAQNFVTIPVDLGNVLSDSITVAVMAGGVTIAEAEVDVGASYIDRLAIIVMVVLVLAALLWFIRRRVRTSDAGTIVHSSEGPARTPRRK